jgi:hypothetical protein
MKKRMNECLLIVAHSIRVVSFNSSLRAALLNPSHVLYVPVVVGLPKIYY